MPADNAILAELEKTIQSRKMGNPTTSYTAMLLQGNEDDLLKKIIEEAGESVLAAKSRDKVGLTNELADLWFHCLVVMTRYNLPLSDVFQTLKERQKMSGLEEKNSRHKNTE